jgi:hypothetical protein
VGVVEIVEPEHSHLSGRIQPMAWSALRSQSASHYSECAPTLSDASALLLLLPAVLWIELASNFWYSRIA